MYKTEKNRRDERRLMSRKQKRAITITGITGAVYLVFRYLLPLVVPFFIALLLAKAVWPAVRFLNGKGKVPKTWAAGGVLALYFALFLGIMWIIGGKLVEQLDFLVDKIPQYVDNICSYLDGACSQLDHLLHLESGSIMGQLRIMVDGAEENVVSFVMPYLMTGSLPVVKWLVEFFTVSTVAVISAVMIIGEREEIKKWKETTMFRREIAVISRRLGEVGGAYLKVELIIMLLTTAICMAGLTLMGNPYGILFGGLIGILDALPIFGTGTVFIPWILVEVIRGRLLVALYLGILYAVCYFLREILEARMLGGRIGLSPLQTMAAMYIGLKLFGIFGLFLGPIGWILVKEIDKTCCSGLK